jgi:hypothetical protein
VEEFFEDVVGRNGRAFFKRTLTLIALSAQTEFHFRAAAGKSAEKISTNEFRIEKLTLRLPEGTNAIVHDGSPAEVLVPLTLPQGKTTLTLEYQW